MKFSPQVQEIERGEVGTGERRGQLLIGRAHGVITGIAAKEGKEKEDSKQISIILYKAIGILPCQAGCGFTLEFEAILDFNRIEIYL